MKVSRQKGELAAGGCSTRQLVRLLLSVELCERVPRVVAEREGWALVGCGDGECIVHADAPVVSTTPPPELDSVFYKLHSMHSQQKCAHLAMLRTASAAACAKGNLLPPCAPP